MDKNAVFKLKLIFPSGLERRTRDPFDFNYTPPYGTGVLTGFLRKHNYCVEQEDLSVRFDYRNSKSLPLKLKILKNIWLNNNRNYKEIREFVRSDKMKGTLALFADKILDYFSLEGFNAVGFSIFSRLQFPFVLMLAKRLKERCDTTIIFGGSFITLHSQLLKFGIFDSVDYMITGDGAVPLLRLIDYLQGKIDLSCVPNLIYRQNGKVISNPREEYSLEDMPMPDFEGLPINLYKRREYNGGILLPYQLSRGCRGRCTFCTYQEIHHKVEFKSYAKVLSELGEMKERYNSKIFYFCDDAINNSYEYLEGFCDYVIKNKLNINWITPAKVGNLNRQILRKMKDAGCVRLDFGIESGSDNLLKSMNKGFTSQEASQALKEVSEAGIIPTISLITGFPYETKKDIAETQDFIKKNKKYIYLARVFILNLNYGSPLYFHPKEYGIEKLIPTDNCFSFGFDETNGLKWEQKREQQKKSYRKILKITYDNLGFPNKIKLKPFLGDSFD